jgi:FeS assembly SUF system regulator
MLRITKLTDYAIVVLSHLVTDDAAVRTARDLADESNLPAPTVSKILKELCKAGLVISQRGLQGGYRLARPASRITVADILHAVEGPLALTDCNRDSPEVCGYAGACPVEANWVRINDAIFRALSEISLQEMARPLSPKLVSLGTKPERAHV